MAGKFQPANSDYNKDATWSKFSIDGTTKVTLSEAIAKDSDDNYITVYGFVEYPLVGVEQFGNLGWVFEASLCKFQIPKKDYSNEYKGKKTEVKAEPGMLAAVKMITDHGFDKPFKAMFDFGCALPVANEIITGLGENGQPSSAADLAMIGKFFLRLEPIEKLEKMEGKEIKEYTKGGGGYGGSKGQTEAEKLKDRMVFVKSLVDGNESFDAILTALHGTDVSAPKETIIRGLLTNLFS